jgi:hypothetical protein
MLPDCKERLRIQGQTKPEPVPIKGLNGEVFEE